LLDQFSGVRSVSGGDVCACTRSLFGRSTLVVARTSNGLGESSTLTLGGTLFAALSVGLQLDAALLFEHVRARQIARNALTVDGRRQQLLIVNEGKIRRVYRRHDQCASEWSTVVRVHEFSVTL